MELLPTMKEIVKVGLAACHNGALLLVRKNGAKCFILPGGKPEKNEENLETLRREVWEELRCDMKNVNYIGSFSDIAAEIPDTKVTVQLFAGSLVGEPTPASEIDEIAWVALQDPLVPLAPSLTNKIIPHLCVAESSETSCLIDEQRELGQCLEAT